MKRSVTSKHSSTRFKTCLTVGTPLPERIRVSGCLAARQAAGSQQRALRRCGCRPCRLAPAGGTVRRRPSIVTSWQDFRQSSNVSVPPCIGKLVAQLTQSC